MLRYAAVVKSAGGAIHDLVREWTDEWLVGVGERGGADAEARLRGMVEEVVWGNVIWYGIGGWASRGDVDVGSTPTFSCTSFSALFRHPAKRKLTYLLGFSAHLVTSVVFLPKIFL